MSPSRQDMRAVRGGGHRDTQDDGPMVALGRAALRVYDRSATVREWGSGLGVSLCCPSPVPRCRRTVLPHNPATALGCVSLMQQATDVVS